MAGPFIRLGDKHTHGGAVVEASMQSDTGGLPIARLGDKTVCPFHGVVPIISGDMTSCGATLIASQQATVDKV